MAKHGGRNFKKGFDPRRNLNGSPGLTKEQIAIRDSYPKELSKVMTEAQYMSEDQIIERLKDKNLSMLHRGVYKTLQKYLETGDYTRYLEPIVNRLLGKPKETFDVRALPKPFIIRSHDGLIEEKLGFATELDEIKKLTGGEENENSIGAGVELQGLQRSEE